MITVYYGIPNKKINITNKLIPLKNNKNIILLCKNGIRARNYHTWANKKHPIFIREID